MIESVTIAAVLPHGISKKHHRFSNKVLASKYIKRSNSYITGKIYQHTHIFQGGDGNWWATVALGDVPVSLNEELERFYKSKAFLHNYTPYHVSSSKNRSKRRARISNLLEVINIKYGSIDKADNAPELLKLRRLVNGYDD